MISPTRLDGGAPWATLVVKDSDTDYWEIHLLGRGGSLGARPLCWPRASCSGGWYALSTTPSSSLASQGASMPRRKPEGEGVTL